MSDERCPWPFPGPYYDWTTDDELNSIVGQLRQLAGADNDSLRLIADNVAGVRALLSESVPIPEDVILGELS